MQLELKHLAPYLSCDLKIHNLITRTTKTMIGCEFIKELRVRTTDGLYAYDSSKIKPILRPLSDLTKEAGTIDFKTIYTLSNHNELIMFIEDIRNEVFSFKSLKVLLENHFDVFNLIENNLAIDKNTIKQ